MSERYWLVHNWMVTKLVGYVLIAGFGLIGAGLLYAVLTNKLGGG